MAEGPVDLFLSCIGPYQQFNQFSFDTYLQLCCSLMHEAALPPAPTTIFFPDTATALKVGEWNSLK